MMGMLVLAAGWQDHQGHHCCLRCHKHRDGQQRQHPGQLGWLRTSPSDGTISDLALTACLSCHSVRGLHCMHRLCCCFEQLQHTSHFPIGCKVAKVSHGICGSTSDAISGTSASRLVLLRMCFWAALCGMLLQPLSLRAVYMMCRLWAATRRASQLRKR